ncbi:hypothetical protein [Cupriavidus plantarum]|uniref:hypothetical protein n=1 Tax=Cupriavidus plantarum TaxID=942865 RepID=UPI001ABF8F6B|nr:hypothetical protein [Cupriavidus plantarum]
MNRVKAVNHDQLAGLQIADAVATSAYYAVNMSQYGETEDRYLRLLARNLYRARNGSVDGYGLKFWCSDAMEGERQRVLAAVRGEEERWLQAPDSRIPPIRAAVSRRPLQAPRLPATPAVYAIDRL